MKRKRRVIGVILLLLIVAGCAYAATSNGEIRIKSNLNTGSVDLDLTAYSETDGKQIEAEDGHMVTPNQTVSYIPRVTNLRTDCYVRLHMDVTMEKQIEQPITADSIVGLNENWIRQGDYFYYKEILKTDETTDVFQGIHIPGDWVAKTASGFKINLVADAVQAESFSPDFTSSSPWGSLAIEEAKAEDDTVYRVGKAVPDPHVLTYLGNSTFEVTSEDFFKNFKTMLPKNQFEDQITLRNKAAHTIQLQFKCSAKKTNLLKKIGLKLMIGDKTYYTGNLAAAGLSEYKTLAIIDPKDAQKLKYTLTIPKALQNKYSVLKDSVIWSFKAIEIDEHGRAVQTGDHSKLPYILIGVAAIAFITLLFVAKRRKKP